MKTIVVDTSALLRLFIPDGPIPDQLEDRIAEASRHDAILLAPSLILAEATQVLLKKERSGFLSGEEADLIRSAILGVPMETVSERDLVESAHAIAREEKLSVYDALFFALARERHAELITADRKLARAWARQR